MWKLLSKFKKSKSGWKKIKDLRVGMKIAVPRAGLLAHHLHNIIPASSSVIPAIKHAPAKAGAGIQTPDSGVDSPAESAGGDDNGGDIVWDEIVAIKPLGREQVYDIEVEGSRNFVGNNIFAHNTFISGNVGIGSSTPGYKLAVAGEVAAQAFVNISTATEKKDIAYLSEDDDKTILEKIRATNVATYQYRNDIALSSVIPAKAGIQFNRNGLDSGSGAGMTNGDDLTQGKRLGLIAENAPAEVLAVGGKGVDLYKLGTFVLAGLKAESKERESGVLALDTRLAAEMVALGEKTTTKQLTVLGSANGDLLYIATGEAGRPSADIAKADIEPSLNNQSPDPIFRITSSGEVQVRDDIVFSPKTTTIALNNPEWVTALSEEEAQEQLRPAYKGAVIVAGAADGIHVYNAKTHKEMSGYTYIGNASTLASSSLSFLRKQESSSDASGLDSGSPPLAEVGMTTGGRGVTQALPKHIAADYFTQSFDENTLGQWPFRTLADATGRGNDLSMSGSVSLAAEGVRGTGAAFDGSGYLIVPSPFQGEGRVRVGEGGVSSSSRGAGMTLGAWVKFNSLSSGQKIISQDGAFSLGLGDGGYAEATAQGASKVATRKSLAALDNDWHFVVASYSALKARLDIYVDGALANGDLVGEIPLTGLGLSSEPVKLGVGFYGTMDDAFIAAGDVDVSSSAALASPSVIPAIKHAPAKAGAGIQTPETVRSNYLIGRKALNYGLAATSGLQAQPISAAIDEVNNMLYVGTTDGQIITVDLGASAVVGRTNPLLFQGGVRGGSDQAVSGGSPTTPNPLLPLRQGYGGQVGQEGISALAVSSGAGRTLAAIVGNNLWLDTETISVRDSLASKQIQGVGSYSSVPSPFQGEGRVRVGEGGRRALTVFEDLLVTGGKILPEASSGLPLFAITADGVVEGLAFRDVSFANELANASFEYWEKVPPLPEGGLEPVPYLIREGVGEKPLAWQGSKKSADAKFGLSSIQITDGVLSTTLANGSDFASSTVTLSAWVKSSVANDAKLSIVVPGSSLSFLRRQESSSNARGLDAGSEAGMTEGVVAASAYHSGSGQWERLIVTAQVPSPLPGEGRPKALRSLGEGGVRVQIVSQSKTALVDGVMFQRGGLATAFVPSVQDTLLANPQYLNFTAAIAVASSSPSSAGPTEGLLAKLPAGTFANTIRIDQLSVGLVSSPPLQGGAGVVSIQITASAVDSGITSSSSSPGNDIVCIASGSSCRQSGSLTVSPNQELLIKYSVQGEADARATVNLRYYPLP